MRVCMYVSMRLMCMYANMYMYNYVYVSCFICTCTCLCVFGSWMAPFLFSNAWTHVCMHVHVIALLNFREEVSFCSLSHLSVVFVV